MHRAVHAFAAVALIAPSWATAQVWKCAGEQGRPVYQDAPCPEGRALRDFAADPPPVSVIPIRPIPGTVTRATAPSPSREPRSAPGRRAVAAHGDPAERRHLQPGMHEGEVMARIGPPDLKSGGGGRKLARWTYMPVPADPQTLTTVVFEYGKVIEVERKVVR